MSLAPATTATGSMLAGTGALVGAGLTADPTDGVGDLGLLPATGLATLGLAALGVALLLVGLSLYRVSVRLRMAAPGRPGGDRAG